MRHDIVDHGIVDFMNVLGCCIEQTGGSDIIDLPWYTRGIVMDEALGLRLEDFGRSAGHGDAVIDILNGLLLGVWFEEKPEGNAIQEVGMGRSFENMAQIFLAAQEDFEGYFFADG